MRKPVRLGEIVHVAGLDPIVDQLRTRGRRSRLEVVDGDLPGPDPFESSESADRLQRIGGACAELDPRDREILLGTLVDGSTPGERRWPAE